jgi:hypothetical protein
LCHDPLQGAFAIGTLFSFELEKHPDPVAPGLRQLDVERGTFPTQELIRDLEQDPSPIAGLRVAPARAPVVEVAKDLQPLLDGPPGTPPVHPRDKPDTTRSVFTCRTEEARSGYLRHNPPSM